MYNEYIIIHSPFKKKPLPINLTEAQKKLFKLYYWSKGRWFSEDKDLLVTTPSKSLTYLITNWLNLLEEEGIIQKKVTVQDVALDGSNSELFVSLDRNPFSKENSTFEKLMIIEGLLKTIHEGYNTIKSIRLLVHHKPLQDTHLDFSQPWPITGYLQNLS